MTVTQLRDALLKVLSDHGIVPNQNGFHGWRCEHPDRYPDCHCVPDLLDALESAAQQEARAGLVEALDGMLYGAERVRVAFNAALPVEPSATWRNMRAAVSVLAVRAEVARAALAAPEPSPAPVEERCGYANSRGGACGRWEGHAWHHGTHRHHAFTPAGDERTDR